MTLHRMRHGTAAHLVVFALVGLSHTLSAQEPTAADSAAAPESIRPPAADADSAGAAPPADSAPAGVIADTIALPSDTTAVSTDTTAADSLEHVLRDIRAARERLTGVRRTLESMPEEDRLQRSPKGAVLRAFALPGWGQLYTGHRMRAVMYGGARIGFTVLYFLKQAEVNEFKDDISRARLDFVAAEQAANPDSVFSREDTLALLDRFDQTAEGAELEADLEAKQKRREDYFTYAGFAVLFSAIDAFVSAHLEPYDKPAELEVRRTPERWELGLRVRVGSPAGDGRASKGDGRASKSDAAHPPSGPAR